MGIIKEHIDRYGIVSDPHHQLDIIRLVSNYLHTKGIKKVLCPGDLCLDWNLRQKLLHPEETPLETLEEQIHNVLSELSTKFEKVIVIPGNHDPKTAWEKAVKGLSKPNIVDLYSNREYEDNGILFIGLPGYFEYTHDVSGNVNSQEVDLRLTYLKKNGVYTSETEISSLVSKYSKHRKPKILLTHGLPKTDEGKLGPDTHPLWGNVGSEAIRHLYDSLRNVIMVGGHNHHMAATAFDENFEVIANNKKFRKGVINGGNFLLNCEGGFQEHIRFGILNVHYFGYFSFESYQIDHKKLDLLQKD
ncbi:MAG: metallophosphoesterase family protein [Nanoarchaeota archaeon]|nr:metallophosphoesterase family protein [Nanoarchaeota archaeon]